MLSAGAALTMATADETDAAPAWSNPKAMAIRRAGLLGSAQAEPNFLSNLDCVPVTYRLTSGGANQTSCFSDAAFGLMDVDSGAAIFNGTDEAVPLLPYSAHQTLVPWPGTLNILALDAANTGGSYLSMYRDSLDILKDQRNLLGQLVAKQFTGPPDTPLLDPAGHQLIVNPQTMAFSGGSWLIAETLGGSFVRINLATLSVLPFAPSFGATGSPALLHSQVAVSDDGHYVAIENDAAQSFKVYDLTTCQGGTAGLQPENCSSYDYWAYVKQQINGLQGLRHVRFLNSGLLGFEAVTSDTATMGTYVLAPRGDITSLADYVALGDSYTSGEGAFDYLSGTDTPDNTCHLSRRSYPLLLAHDLSTSASGHSVACSGAVIKDVGSQNDDYRGQVREGPSYKQLREAQANLLASVETNFVPGYIAQHNFVKQYQPKIITVSIGGNDIGFGDIVQTCVEPHLSLHLDGNTCFNTYEDRLEVLHLIDRTRPRWSALYRQLRQESPNTQLYAVGYPEVAVDTGNCGLNVHLNKSELEFTDELTTYLNNTIARAAKDAGIAYVDISQALAGHRLCEASSYDVAVNGLTAGNDAGPLGIKVLGKESYHPNALGHLLIEQTILKQTHNLTAAAEQTPDDATAGQKLLDVAASGRAVTARVSDDNLSPSLIYRGRNIPLSVDGVQDGLSPNSSYSIRLDGAGGTPLESLTSGPDGNITAEVPLPDTIPPGGHTLDVTGSDQAGEPVDVTQPIYVGASDTDTDGDGIPDGTDACPAAINSGQDADQDGVDDACDNLVGAPPGGGQGGDVPPTGSGTVSDIQGGTGSTIPPASQSASVAQAASLDSVLGVENTPLELVQGGQGQLAGITLNEFGTDGKLPITSSSKTFKPIRATGILPAREHLLQPPHTVDREDKRTLNLPVIPWLFWLVVIFSSSCLLCMFRSSLRKLVASAGFSSGFT